jgi:hypothetical protein
LSLVKRHWFHPDGSYHIEFVPYQKADGANPLSPLIDGAYRAAWWASDEDVDALLAAAGWASPPEPFGVCE